LSLQSESDPATCYVGDMGDVSKCDQEDVQENCRSGAEELDVLGYPSQAWLRAPTKQTVVPSD